MHDKTTMLQTDQRDNTNPQDDDQEWNEGRVLCLGSRLKPTVDSYACDKVGIDDRKRRQNPSPPSRITAQHSSPSHLTNHIPFSCQSFPKLYVTDQTREDDIFSPSMPVPPSLYPRKGNSLLHHQISIADYELHSLLETEITSLQERHHGINESLTKIEAAIKSQRSEILLTLASSGGDSKNESFLSAVDKIKRLQSEQKALVHYLEEVSKLLTGRREKMDELCSEKSLSNPFSFDPPSLKPRATSTDSAASDIEGQWFTLTKPTYDNCLGVNDDGNPLYTIGRMSFEMFRPSNLVVSIEAVFNPVEAVVDEPKEVLSVPKGLQEEVRCIFEDDGVGDKAHILRTYHIVTAFIIEPYNPSFGPSSPNAMVTKPIRGIMTTYGYALPDPDKPDRLSIWFSGGKLECGERKSSPKFEVWKRIFGKSNNGANGSRTLREGVMIAAARLFMGAQGYNDGMDEKTGEMVYTFSRPVGGHGKAYVDIVHLDKQIRVMRGHAGTHYVFIRLKGNRK